MWIRAPFPFRRSHWLAARASLSAPRAGAYRLEPTDRPGSRPPPRRRSPENRAAARTGPPHNARRQKGRGTRRTRCGRDPVTRIAPAPCSCGSAGLRAPPSREERSVRPAPRRRRAAGAWALPRSPSIAPRPRNGPTPAGRSFASEPREWSPHRAARCKILRRDPCSPRRTSPPVSLPRFARSPGKRPACGRRSTPLPSSHNRVRARRPPGRRPARLPPRRPLRPRRTPDRTKGHGSARPSCRRRS